MSEYTPISVKELTSLLQKDPNYGIYAFNTMEVDAFKNNETLEVVDAREDFKNSMTGKSPEIRKLKPYSRLAKLPVVCNIEVGEGNNAELIEIPATFIPIDLTEYAPADKFLKSKGFMKFVNAGAITLITKEDFEMFFQEDPEAKDELARIKKEKFQTLDVRKLPSKRKTSEQALEFSPVVDEILNESDLEKSLILFKSVSRKLKVHELKRLEENIKNLTLKEAVQNRLNFFNKKSKEGAQD